MAFVVGGLGRLTDGVAVGRSFCVERERMVVIRKRGVMVMNGWEGSSSSSGGEWNSSSSTGSAGGGGHLETLEYIIHQDGRVEQKVSGVKGSACLNVTKSVEEKLGEVVSREKTTEFFEKEIVQSVNDEVTDELESW